MRPSARASSQICLSCRKRTGIAHIATDFLQPVRRPAHASLSTLHAQRDLSADERALDVDTQVSPASRRRHNGELNKDRQSPPIHRTYSTSRKVSPPGIRRVAVNRVSSRQASIELNPAQQHQLQLAHDLSQRLMRGLHNVSDLKGDPTAIDGMSIAHALKSTSLKITTAAEKEMLHRLREGLAGQTCGEAQTELAKAVRHCRSGQHTVSDQQTIAVLGQLRIVTGSTSTSEQPGETHTGAGRRRPAMASMASMVTPKVVRKQPSALSSSKQNPLSLRKANMETVAARDLNLDSIGTDNLAHLPTLSNDLSRVLFNPGVYQLRDPRSRVYNFNPSLEHIMPVTEFNFDALTPYLTSSEDTRLIDLAKNNGKRYLGSSSSMTSALSQFHFLLSDWRELNIDSSSKHFDETHRTVTILSRSPAAIFLRYRDGVYAVDADKELDEPNILMSLGKSLEKVLTLEPDAFERYRKTNAKVDGERLSDQPEAFHYSGQGRFLLRSQLDAYDDRLPGKGYFDLKTRAVAGVRMQLRDIEAGRKYEIQSRYGNWGSYEREYYDMMRSTFLKYSLQVRMGHMDGIFVAYHNITRMFGFQYIPISEMDLALHGQQDPCLGDQEFRFSINFMEQIFNIGTERFPQQSLRIFFETREPTVSDEKTCMHIFVEPMSEDNIKKVQDTQKAQFEAFERTMVRNEEPESPNGVQGELQEMATGDPSTDVESTHEEDLLPVNTIMTGPTGPAASAADKATLDHLLGSPAAQAEPEPDSSEILGFKLTISNRINDRPVKRPEIITEGARWTIDYTLETMSADLAQKSYRHTKSKRVSTFRNALNRGSDDYYTRMLRDICLRSAEWRQQQDEIDARSEKVVLYPNKRP